MSLRPKNHAERIERARAWEARRRAAARRYENKVKGEVLDGEREWSSVPPVNSERRKELFKKGFGSKAFVEFVKQQPCVVEACNRTPIDCAHVTSRGAGGGPEDIVPMCRHHHAEQHAMGIETFQRVYGLDLDLLAGLTWQEFTG